jgi:hypothetical protein
LEHDYPEAEAALWEGFTINRLDVPRSLHRCLATKQHRGPSAFRRAQPDSPRLPLASRHARALGGSRMLGRRKIIP